MVRTDTGMDEVLSLRLFAPDDADLNLFELVTRVLTERRAMQFQYRKPGERPTELRHVHPYHLFEFAHRSYLLAHDVKRHSIRTCVLGRMRDATVMNEKFQVSNRVASGNPKGIGSLSPRLRVRELPWERAPTGPQTLKGLYPRPRPCAALDPQPSTPQPSTFFVRKTCAFRGVQLPDFGCGWGHGGLASGLRCLTPVSPQKVIRSSPV